MEGMAPEERIIRILGEIAIHSYSEGITGAELAKKTGIPQELVAEGIRVLAKFKWISLNRRGRFWFGINAIALAEMISIEVDEVNELMSQFQDYKTREGAGVKHER